MDSEPPETYIPGKTDLQPGDYLTHDPSSYLMLHSASLEWSCLSFDIIPDSLGNNRSKFPHTLSFVAGTQAATTDKNKIFVVRCQNLCQTHREPSSESDSSDEDEEPEMKVKCFAHPGTVNRIAVCPQIPRLVGAWSSVGSVSVWDIEEYLNTAESKVPPMKMKPKHRYTGHSLEGFALDFNPHRTGELLSGSCDGTIALWEPIEGGWQVRNFLSTQDKSKGKSIEDVRWKSDVVFAAASVDRSIRFYDCRAGTNPVADLSESHSSDVNVLAWNPCQSELLLSGGDDGATKVWDFRLLDEPIVNLRWHTNPITAVSWHPTDEATFAAACSDDSVSFWDVSVERVEASENREEVPDQLMFHHMGQKEITDVKFHKQIPGLVISTCSQGFNFFKTCNI